MFGSIGVPELFLIIVGLLFWVAPLVAAIWALVTLHRVREGQHAILARLETIERLLQRGGPTP